MNPLDFKQLRKNLKKDTTGFKPVKLAILGDTSTQTLIRAIKGYGIEYGLDVDLYEADYDQIDLQVFNPESDLYQHDSDQVFLYKSSIKLLTKYYKKSIEEKAHFADSVIEKLEEYIAVLSGRLKANIIIANFIELPDMVFNNYGNKVPHSWIFQIRKLNFKLMELAAAHENVFICDLSSVNNQLGRRESFDPQMYIRTAIASNLKFQPYIAQNLMDIIKTSVGKFKKCLILDLDNTTWGGIIGDDGVEGIQIGSLGAGKAFTELQLWAKNLKDRGIILCICSKNTDHIAREPFKSHPDMVLRLEDIAVFVANWENKADNIRHIQAVLNIGFDSMVFLDDNPFERNLVRQELSEVTVPELPEDPAEYIPYLQQFNLFETTSYSGLDKDRTKQYQVEAKRKKAQTSFASVGDYLKNLNMTAIVSPFDTFHTPRIAQLTQRSNQFNLRTIRYSEKDIKDLIESPNHITMYISLEDKYGDYGLISLIVLEKQGEDQLFIDTWIMSCRVLKRDVEKFVLNEIVKIGVAENRSVIVGERLPTPKNVLVENHYKDLGFTEKDNKWFLAVNNYEAQANFIDKKEPVLG